MLVGDWRRTLRVIAVSLLCMSTLVNGAAAASLYERYAGTKITIHTTNTFPDGQVTNFDSSFTITEKGLAAPGVPTMRDRSVVKSDAYTTESLSTNGDTFTLETTQPKTKSWPTPFRHTLTVTMKGDTCRATAKSSHYRSVITCVVVSRGIPQAKDNGKACKAVQSAIAQIRRLAPMKGSTHSLRSAMNCDKMISIAKSIKGAGCPSMFTKVDAALSESQRFCIGEGPDPRGPTGELGVRG